MTHKVYSHACTNLNDALQLVASYHKKPLFVECITGGVVLKSRVSGPKTRCDGECQMEIAHAFHLSDNHEIKVSFVEED